MTWRRKQRILEARVSLRRRLDGRRPLPDGLIIGAHRSGTSSMYKWLEAHPDTGASLRKETEYLSNRFELGDGWYRAHFPSRVRHWTTARRGHQLVTFEATPGYLSHPLVAERTAKLLPNVKLVALLRDPVDRAISHHRHERRLGHDPLEFEEALAAEPSRLAEALEALQENPLDPAKALERYSYLARGRYAEQLERWFEHFDRSQVLVVRSEDMWTDPAGVYSRVLSFVGLRDWRPPTFANFSYAEGNTPRSSSPVSPDVLAWMRDYFRPHNERLYDLVGRDFEWG